MRVEDSHKTSVFPIGSPEGFAAIARAYLRSGWDTKYVYGFTWMGRPIIQLPDDVLRIQEVVYAVKPDVIVEIGVAHGGSLILFASLCKVMGSGRVVGIDIDIRSHNRAAIESHELASYITLIEGDSVAAGTVEAVSRMVPPGARVLVLLDGCHTRAHVLAELEAYAPMVSVGSYIVAMDGIMRDMVGAPRSAPDWGVNNPAAAADDFVARHPEFAIEEPPIPFNEGTIAQRVTYWPNAFIKRLR